MRQVNVTRTPSKKGRNKQGRNQPRATVRSTREQQRAFGKRKPPSIFSRLKDSFFAFLRRPILLLTGGILVLTLLAVLILGGFIGRAISNTNNAVSALATDAGFGISEVHLAGNVHTAPETITAVLGFEPGQSIFTADLRTAREKLMHLPWIADAQVQRRYPDAITVSVVEKLPYALWRSDDGRVFVVERDGGLITDSGVEQFARLPHLIGSGAPKNASDIVDAVAQYRAISARMSAYQWISNRRWDLDLDDNVVVKLPEVGWQKELATLERLIIDKGVLEKDITEIDLRFKNVIYFKLKSGEQSNTVRGDKI